MEMVEAIIDNNNNENKKNNSTKSTDGILKALRQQQKTSELNEMKLEEEEIAREFSRLGGKKIQIYSVMQLRL